MNKYGIKEVFDVAFYDIVSGKPVVYFDTLKVSNVENAASSVSQTGGKFNRKLLTWDHSRTANLPIQDALISTTSLAMLAGLNGAISGSAISYERSYVDGKLAVGITPGTLPTGGKVVVTGSVGVGEAGNVTVTINGDSPINVPLADADDATAIAGKIAQAINNVANSQFAATANLGTVTVTTTAYAVTVSVATSVPPAMTGVTLTPTNLTGGILPSGGTVTITAKGTPIAGSVWYRNGETGIVTAVPALDITGNLITINSPTQQGEVFYERTITSSSTIVFSADRFPGYYKIVGSTWFRREKDGVDVDAQFIIEKAKLQPGFTFSLSAEGEPSSFDFALDVETPPNSTEMYKIVVAE